MGRNANEHAKAVAASDNASLALAASVFAPIATMAALNRGLEGRPTDLDELAATGLITIAALIVAGLFKWGAEKRIKKNK